MMPKWIVSALLLIGAAIPIPAASADVSIAVNKTTQRMTVTIDGVERYSWPVSTGTSGYSTPTGAFTSSRMARTHFSREWDNAPMPHSIFFTDAGHAIHGSRATARLGTPASHGCIRLSLANARVLFNLVQAEGLGSTRIEVTGFDPVGTSFGDAVGTRGDYSRLTSFDPLTNGIMAGASSVQRARNHPQP
jgi:hypothetical protein